MFRRKASQYGRETYIVYKGFSIKEILERLQK